MAYHDYHMRQIEEMGRMLGEIFDIVVEDMDRQARGLKG